MEFRLTMAFDLWRELVEEIELLWLENSAEALRQETAARVPVDTGALRDSFSVRVDREQLSAVVGSELDNAIYNEFGTGQYALKGNGRQDAWAYQDRNGNWHTTRGKKPMRSMQTAYEESATGLVEELWRMLLE